MPRVLTEKTQNPSPGELELLRVIYDLSGNGEVTAREIYEHFGKTLSLSAIQTYMSRMTKKELLVVRSEGRTYYYRPANRSEDLFSRLFRKLRQSLPHRPSRIMAELASQETLSDEDIRQIQAIIDRVKSQRRNTT